MPERLKGMVSKTIMGQPIEGSNPSFSSEKKGFEAGAASGGEAGLKKIPGGIYLKANPETFSSKRGKRDSKAQGRLGLSQAVKIFQQKNI